MLKAGLLGLNFASVVLAVSFFFACQVERTLGVALETYVFCQNESKKSSSIDMLMTFSWVRTEKTH